MESEHVDRTSAPGIFAALHGAVNGIKARLATMGSLTVRDTLMRPYLTPGDVVTAKRVDAFALNPGDLVCVRLDNSACVRRLLRRSGSELVLATEREAWEIKVPLSDLLGQVRSITREGRPVHHKGMRA